MGRGTRARSGAAREQAPPTGPGPLQGWAGGKGPGCPAGGTESGCLLSTRPSRGRAAFRPTSASQRGAEVGLPRPLYGGGHGASSPPHIPPTSQASDPEQSRDSKAPKPGGPPPRWRSRPERLRFACSPGPHPIGGEQVNQSPQTSPTPDAPTPTTILISTTWETVMPGNHRCPLLSGPRTSAPSSLRCIKGLLYQHFLPFDCCRVFQGMNDRDLLVLSPGGRHLGCFQCFGDNTYSKGSVRQHVFVSLTYEWDCWAAG